MDRLIDRGSRLGLVAALLAGAAACSGSLAGRHPGWTLESSRRLRFLVTAPVAVAIEGGAAVPAGLGLALGSWVAHDMAAVGMPVEDDPRRAHDVEVRLSLAVHRADALADGSAALAVLADGVVLDRLATGEHIEPRATFARELARDLVEALAGSSRVAEQADATFGRRTRPLAETVGRRVTMAHDFTSNEMSDPPGRRTPLAAVPGPPPTEAASIAAARARAQQAAADYQGGRFREAYAELEQAYLLDQDPALLHQMGDCLRQLGSPEAPRFYRAAERRAPPR